MIPFYIYGIIIILLLLILFFIIYINYDDNNKIVKNINYYAFFDKESSKIIYNQSNPFYHNLNQVYVSNTIKKELSTLITNYIKYSKNIKNKYKIKSLRLILTGPNGIGKTTLIEALAVEFDCGLIHFPKNNYTEKMIHTFFNDINNLSENNIIIFNNIDFNSLLIENNQLYDLFAKLIIKNSNYNIFIFTFTDISNIPYTFTTDYHIHNHYHLNPNINNIINLIKDNVEGYPENKLEEIKNKLLQLNHKITPGHILPYLLINDDFEKSLNLFLNLIKK
jgi:hypothetical protein